MIQLRERAWRRAFNEFLGTVFTVATLWLIIYWLASHGAELYFGD